MPRSGLVASAAEMRALLPPRPEEASKRDFGSVLCVAGSVNYRGAACLCGVAALRSGAGYATVACPGTVASSLAALTPDLVLLPLRVRRGVSSPGSWRLVDRVLPRHTAVIVGPGLGSLARGVADVVPFARRVVARVAALGLPLVLDADGINVLARLMRARRPIRLPARTVLTPHEGELARVLGVEPAAVRSDRPGAALEAAGLLGAVVVLKGPRTLIASGSSLFANPTGSVALAKAGTGDVLAGIVAGFLAQGLDPLGAARLGAYVHGLAGDVGRERRGARGLLASEVAGFVPDALARLAGDASIPR